jgi:hypothetical protein
MNNMVVITITPNAECQTCWENFLNNIKIDFPDFSMYVPSTSEFYFSVGTLVTQQVLQTYANAFLCKQGEKNIIIHSQTGTEINQIAKPFDPSVTENIGQSSIWLNTLTGELFTCVNNALNNNIWKSSLDNRVISNIQVANKFDFFQDGSTLAFLNLDGDFTDVGGLYNGVNNGTVFVPGLEGQCIQPAAAGSTTYGQVQIPGLPTVGNPGITISGWFQWNGFPNVMVFGLDRYNLFIYRGNIGYNTFGGDLYGDDFTQYANKWVYLSATFTAGDYGYLFINGIRQSSKQQSAGRVINPSRAVIGSLVCLFGVGRSASYRDAGKLDRIRIMDRSITGTEAKLLYEAEYKYITSLGVVI